MTAVARRARAQAAWYAVAQKVVAGFCRVFWRVEVSGREHIPSRGPFVLSPVHRSNIDTLLCGCVTSRRLRYMAKDGLWKYRAAGALITSLGGFPVHRGMPDREALRTCEEAIRAGDPVVLFPEGTRQSGPTIQPVLDGAAFVAARTGVSIIPVGIGGSEWAMPKGARFLKPVKVAIVIGAPIPPPERTAGARVGRRQVSETSARLQHELQDLYDQAMVRAGRAAP